jgi:hypothetical protein
MMHEQNDYINIKIENIFKRPIRNLRWRISNWIEEKKKH